MAAPVAAVASLGANERFLLSRVVDALKNSGSFVTVTGADDSAYEHSCRGNDIVATLTRITGLSNDDVNTLARALLENDIYWGRTSKLFSAEVFSIYTLYVDVRKKTAQQGKQGVFTALAGCYSATCTPARSCYRPTCANRKLVTSADVTFASIADKILSRNNSIASTTNAAEVEVSAPLFSSWEEMVGPIVASSLSKVEKAYQNAVFELIYKTEKRHLADLITWKELVMVPVETSNELIKDPVERRLFVQKVFMNLNELIELHTEMDAAILERQRQQPVIRTISDVLLRFVPRFEALYVPNAAGQAVAGDEIEEQKKRNPVFAAFIKAREQHKSFRSLGCSHFILVVRDRIGKFDNILGNVIEKAMSISPDHPEVKPAKAVQQQIAQLLVKMGELALKIENRRHMTQLIQSLTDATPCANFFLEHEDRVLIVSYVDVAVTGPKGTAPHSFHLFDNGFVMCQQMPAGKQTIVHAVQWNHLEVLLDVEGTLNYPSLGYLPVSAAGSRTSLTDNLQRIGSQMIGNFAVSLDNLMAGIDTTGDHTFTLVVFGRPTIAYKVQAPNDGQKEQWFTMLSDKIVAAKKETLVYDLVPLTTFNAEKSLPNCCVEYDNLFTNQKNLLVGCKDGLYNGSCDPTATTNAFRRVFDLIHDIVKIEMFAPQQRCLAVLGVQINPSSGNPEGRQQIMTLPYDVFDQATERAVKAIPVPRSQGTSIIKISHDRLTLIGIKNKTNAPDTSAKLYTCKVLLPNEQGHDRLHKESKLMIGANCLNVHMRDLTLTVATAHGFTAIDIKTTQSKTIPQDPDELRMLEATGKAPIDIFEMDKEYLLCYAEVAYIVNKAGARGRTLAFSWTGSPKSFALDLPYVLAFSERFIEVRHLGTRGQLVQLIAVPQNHVHKTRTEPLPPPLRTFRHLAVSHNHIAPMPGSGVTRTGRTYVTSPGTTMNDVSLHMLLRVSKHLQPNMLGRRRTVPLEPFD